MRDHIAGTTFLYKIVPSVNLKKIHQINVRCINIICNKNNNKPVFNLSVDGETDSFSGLYLRYPYAKKIHVLHKQIEHLFILVIR